MEEAKLSETKRTDGVIKKLNKTFEVIHFAHVGFRAGIKKLKFRTTKKLKHT